MRPSDVKYLLSPASLPVLARLSHGKALCAFDFDGTLAPISARPERAELRSRTRRLLTQVAALYPCIVLSGRSRADLLVKLAGVPVRRIVGNHGAETGAIDAGDLRLVRKWKAALAPKIRSLPGVWIEDKGLSLSVHYRQAPPGSRARSRILMAMSELENVEVFGGKRIVNLTIRGARHKGDALASEMERLGCPMALFVGDDDNDESAFDLDADIVPVHVGRRKNSRARFYLREQREVDRLLERLVTLRESAKQ